MRLPLDTSDDVDEDPTGNRALWDRGLLNGASQKVSATKPVVQKGVPSYLFTFKYFGNSTKVNDLILYLNAFQCDTICNFHVGEVITSLQKTTLIPGGSESLVYTTLSGAIGMLVPFTSHEVTQFIPSVCIWEGEGGRIA